MLMSLASISIPWRAATTAALLATGTLAAAQGLTLAPADAPRLQTRIGLQTNLPSDGSAMTPATGVMLGDYYFSRTRLGGSDVSGGFRATSGVLLGARSMMLGTPGGGQGLSLARVGSSRLTAASLSDGQADPTPYFGLGWSGLSARRGWGLSADLGFAARPSSAGGLRVSGAQGLDELLRELRLTPVLHLGVSYAF
jgi:hypothetical protein